MSPPELIFILNERGVHIGRDDNGQLKLKCNPSTLSPEIIEALRRHKDELHEYLRLISLLRIGMRIQSPYGIGRVWELYPVNDRCGVLVDGESHPKFFSIMDAIVANFSIRRAH